MQQFLYVLYFIIFMCYSMCMKRLTAERKSRIPTFTASGLLVASLITGCSGIGSPDVVCDKAKFESVPVEPNQGLLDFALIGRDDPTTEQLEALDSRQREQVKVQIRAMNPTNIDVQTGHLKRGESINVPIAGSCLPQ